MTYKDIYECPIKVYHRIIETNNVKLLEYESLAESVSGKKEKSHTEEELFLIFQSMSDSIIDTFGVSEKLYLLFSKQKDINRLEIRLLEGDAAAETDLILAKRKMESMQKRFGNDEDKDISKTHVRLRRIVESEFKRDIDKLSVHEFYTDLKDIEEKVRKQEIEENKLKKAM